MTEASLKGLQKIVGERHFAFPPPKELLHDATQQQLRGSAAAAVFPADSQQVAEVVRYCYRRSIPMHVRGGGTGLAGGAVPRRGSVIISLSRLNRLRAFEPDLWRMNVEAGVTNQVVAETARTAGLLYPPDPGARQSHIGGNIATNAGGAHTFKYGVTGHWVTGLEVVTAKGEILQLGGPLRKDVAGYDLKSLFVGSEGTLGIITAAWLKLVPLPHTAIPVVATFRSARAGGQALQEVLAKAQLPTSAELLDGATLDLARERFPIRLTRAARFMLIFEAEGGPQAARELRRQLISVLDKHALTTYSPTNPSIIQRLWHWRYDIYRTISETYGGMVSEDIGVPIDRVPEAIEGVYAIGKRRRLPVCNWGHAGDGNLHATFLVDPNDRDMRTRATAAVGDLFDLALKLGGTISGEHGVGRIKRPWLARQAGRSLPYQRQIKRTFDPKGLFNPGVKLS